MAGRRSLLPLLTAWSAALASAPALAWAQQPYSVPGQYGPYPSSGPYAQPLPYSPQSYTPGYQQLSNNADESYTLGRARSWPVFRASAGAAFTLADGGQIWPSFVVDVNAGYRWAFHSRALLVFEGGYSFDSEPLTGGHYGTIGAGPELFVNRYLSIGWEPRLVIGESWRGFAIGVRNSLTVPLAFRVAHVEVGHQYLRVEGLFDQHELRVTAGVDLAAVVYLYIRRTVSGQ